MSGLSNCAGSRLAIESTYWCSVPSGRSWADAPQPQKELSNVTVVGLAKAHVAEVTGASRRTHLPHEARGPGGWYIHV